MKIAIFIIALALPVPLFATGQETQPAVPLSSAPVVQPVAKSTQTVTDLVSRAAALAMEKHFDEALSYFLAAEKLDPANATIEMHLGLTHLHLNHFDEAQQKLERALALDPSLEPAIFSLALFYEHKAAHAPPACHCREDFLKKSRNQWTKLAAQTADKGKKEFARRHITRIEELLK